MPEIGLFPLGMVLLPTEQVPLHVFEPRYRELIGECLDRSIEFGLVYVSEGGMHAVGTRASVAEVTERFDDGRLDILVRGGARFRLVRLSEGRSFHTALAEDLADEHDPASAADAEHARDLFVRLAALTGAGAEVPDPGEHPLSFALAGQFGLSPDLKQELLQATSERQRLRRVCELFEAAAQAVVRQRDVAGRARSNGHARSLPPRA